MIVENALEGWIKHRLTGQGRKIETAAMACFAISTFPVIEIAAELNRRLELAVDLPKPTDRTDFLCFAVV